MRPAAMAELALAEAHRAFVDDVRGLTIDEALSAAGGYRSILGIAKHCAAWSAVYRSFAFDDDPRSWERTEWPRGLIDTIEPTQGYWDEILAWFDATYDRWLIAARASDLTAPVPVHWGATMPLFEIVNMAAAHWVYHGGEINALVAIVRGQAWELSEEVEENHISTAGHRLRPEWMSAEQVERYEAYLARRDAELHGP